MAPLADDDSLIDSGRLDSFAIIEIVAFLETKLGADFTALVFEAEDFESVANIAALVEGKPESS